MIRPSRRWLVWPVRQLRRAVGGWQGLQAAAPAAICHSLSGRCFLLWEGIGCFLMWEAGEPVL